MGHFTMVYKDVKRTLNFSILYSQCRFDYRPLPASTLKALSGSGPDSRERPKSCLATMKFFFYHFFQQCTHNNCLHWSCVRWAHVITNQNEGNCARDYSAWARPVYDKIWKVFHTLKYHKANLYSYKSQKNLLSTWITKLLTNHSAILNVLPYMF